MEEEADRFHELDAPSSFSREGIFRGKRRVFAGLRQEKREASGQDGGDVGDPL